MKIEATEFLPKARHEALITKEVDDELLVYDLKRDRAHCLNETAAAIWRLCDGQRSPSDIAAEMQKAEGGQRWAVSSQPGSGRHLTPDPQTTTPNIEIVWLALDQLRRSHLLEGGENHQTFSPPALAGFAQISRREAVRRIGLGAAIALPLVASLTAPTPVEAAASCGAKCKPCSTSADCCGVCSSSSVPGCPSSTPRCT